MAKRRKEKYSVELTGLIIFLISVIGIGNFGIVGSIIKAVFVFLFGYWWFILNFMVLILSIYMIFKREVPKFFTFKLVNIYVLIMSLLVFNTISLMSSDSTNVFALINEYSEVFFNITSGYEFKNLNLLGGGLIGTVFYALFNFLFAEKGTYIVISIISLISLFLLMDLSLIDLLIDFKDFIVNAFETSKEKKQEKKELKKAKERSKAKVEELKTKEAEEEKRTLEDTTTFEAISEAKVEKERKGNVSYTLPSIDLLDKPDPNPKGNSKEFIDTNIKLLEQVLADFQIEGKVVKTHEGPAVTQFEVETSAGTKLSRITGIHKEIALALSAKDVRIQAPIPGKNTVGIEIPNLEISTVPIREVLDRVPKKMMNANILVALGKDLMGRSMFGDLSKMPHLLVAGSTGSGKSVCINSFIASILMFNTPEEVKLMLIDPKKVELSHYNGIPHLITPVVTDPKDANVALKYVVQEMEKRYKIFEKEGFKNIAGYNKKNKQDKMSYWVVIIDEMADLMLVAQKEVEDSIMRITQMARAAGIHLITATQRPSTDIITGVVKANIPSRIAFTVASYIDSRTILDQSGAEKLLGRGDMLYLPMGDNHPTRIQGTFISDDEVERLIYYVKTQDTPSYTEISIAAENTYADSTIADEDYEDPIYNEVYEFAIEQGKISASLIQRRFRVGYNRAARILDMLEARGIVGPPKGSRPRDVIVQSDTEEITEEE